MRDAVPESMYQANRCNLHAVLSSWLDYAPRSQAMISREQHEDLDELPANARVVTADANSMCTNINIEHALALKTLRWFLDEL